MLLIYHQFFLIHIECREHFTIELQTDKGLTNHKTTSFWDLLKTSRPWKLELQLTKCLRNFFFPFLYPLMQQILTLPNLQNRSCWTSEVGNMKCCARIWPTSQVGCFKFLNQICSKKKSLNQYLHFLRLLSCQQAERSGHSSCEKPMLFTKITAFYFLAPCFWQFSDWKMQQRFRLRSLYPAACLDNSAFISV